jgi:hypothetical protein
MISSIDRSRNLFWQMMQEWNGSWAWCVSLCWRQEQVRSQGQAAGKIQSVSSRGLKRNVVYVGWLIAPSYMSPSAGEGRGLLGLSQWVQLCTWSLNKLWRSNSIFNQCFQLVEIPVSFLYFWIFVTPPPFHPLKKMVKFWAEIDADLIPSNKQKTFKIILLWF